MGHSGMTSSPTSFQTANVNNSAAFHINFDPTSPEEDDFYSFHCHWNHCDFSFTSLFELGDHLTDHIPSQPELPISTPLDVGFQCQWDECQAKAHSETDLVQHVKEDHLLDTAKEHHQCLWVLENGSTTSEVSPNFQEQCVICVVHQQKHYHHTWKQTILARERGPIHVIGKTAFENINPSPNAKKPSVISALTQA